MGSRVEEKELCKVVEFVLVYDDNNIWISLECLSPNKMVEQEFRKAISNIEEVKNLCIKICKGIDKILNINENRDTIINIIKAFNSEAKKMPIYTISLGTITEYDENNIIIEHSNNIFTDINKGALSYIQKNNEYIRLYNYLTENCNDFTDLGSELYYIVREYYEKNIKNF